MALVLGLASLMGHGLSRGVGLCMSLKSELAQRGVPAAAKPPVRQESATFVAFALTGALPLPACAVPLLGAHARFGVALVLSATALAGVGVWRAPFVDAGRLRSAFEMVSVGALAAAVAYAVGAIANTFVGGLG